MNWRLTIEVTFALKQMKFCNEATDLKSFTKWMEDCITEVENLIKDPDKFYAIDCREVATAADPEIEEVPEKIEYTVKESRQVKEIKGGNAPTGYYREKMIIHRQVRIFPVSLGQPFSFSLSLSLSLFLFSKCVCERCHIDLHAAACLSVLLGHFCNSNLACSDNFPPSAALPINHNSSSISVFDVAIFTHADTISTRQL